MVLFQLIDPTRSIAPLALVMFIIVILVLVVVGWFLIRTIRSQDNTNVSSAKIMEIKTNTMISVVNKLQEESLLNSEKFTRLDEKTNNLKVRISNLERDNSLLLNTLKTVHSLISVVRVDLTNNQSTVMYNKVLEVIEATLQTFQKK